MGAGDGRGGCLVTAGSSVASVVAQMVKNLPAVQGDLGSIPGLGGSLKEGMATLSSILAWRIPMDRGAWQAIVHGAAKSQTRLNTAELDSSTQGKRPPHIFSLSSGTQFCPC